MTFVATLKAPQVSQTEGPSAVNASVTTIRGVVKSNWVRHKQGASTVASSAAPAMPVPLSPAAGVVFELTIQIPVGSRGMVTVPLLYADPKWVRLEEVQDGVVVWRGANSVHSVQTDSNDGELVQHPAWMWMTPHLGAAPSGEPVLEFETTAGVFHFRVVV